MRQNRRSLLKGLALSPALAIATPAKFPDGQEILKSFNATDWARAFVAYVKFDPSIATDEATMAGWFANALMRGFDEKWSRINEQFSERALREAVARGYCHPVNKHKTMDADLAEAVTQEVAALKG